jgi:hypothetical protein
VGVVGFVLEVGFMYDGGKSSYYQQCLTMADPTAQEAEQITTPLLLHYAV